jgi:hypothetical protein
MFAYIRLNSLIFAFSENKQQTNTDEHRKNQVEFKRMVFQSICVHPWLKPLSDPSDRSGPSDFPGRGFRDQTVATGDGVDGNIKMNQFFLYFWQPFA